MNDIVTKIRKGELDCNNHELFFSILIKGLLLNLDECVSIRNNPVPHFILHTGDDIMYLNQKGYNYNIEPLEVSNEDYVYNIIPRCNITPSTIDIIPDQLTNPYSRGVFEYSTEDSIYTLTGEFRRMPVKLSCDLKYQVDSYKDMLELIQQIITKLAFIRTYDIVYMGQVIKCSYKIPENFSDEHLMDIDGTTQESRNKLLSLTLEIETNIPVYSNESVVSSSKYISNIHGPKKIEIYDRDNIDSGIYSDVIKS